jgi:hypothetical protein
VRLPAGFHPKPARGRAVQLLQTCTPGTYTTLSGSPLQYIRRLELRRGHLHHVCASYRSAAKISIADAILHGVTENRLDSVFCSCPGSLELFEVS